MSVDNRFRIGAMVPEFRSLSVKMDEGSKGVAVFNLESCILLEVNNRNDARQRTVLSLTYFAKEQLMYPDVIEKNMKVVLDEFQKQGGVIDKTTEFRLYGGSSDRDTLRSNLKDALRKSVSTDVVVKEPIGHDSTGKTSTDYLFKRSGVSFRKADCREEDPWKDVFSRDLCNDDGTPNKPCVESFQEAMNKIYGQVGVFYETQVRGRFDEYHEAREGSPEDLETALEVLCIKVHELIQKN